MNLIDLLKKFSTSDSIWLAVIPLLGTALAYAYQAGSVHYYDIPLNLVKVDVQGVVIATAAFGASILQLFGLLLPVRVLFKSKHVIVRVLGDSSFYAVFAFFAIKFYPNIPYGDVIVLSVFFIPLSKNLTAPFFSKSKQKSYLAKLDEYLSRDEEKALTTKDSVYGIISLCLMFGAAVYGMGYSHASSADEYWTVPDLPNMAIVEIYGDTYILKPFDPATHEFGNAMMLLEKDGVKSKLLTKIKTGVLKRSADKR